MLTEVETYLTTTTNTTRQRGTTLRRGTRTTNTKGDAEDIPDDLTPLLEQGVQSDSSGDNDIDEEASSLKRYSTSGGMNVTMARGRGRRMLLRSNGSGTNPQTTKARSKTKNTNDRMRGWTIHPEVGTKEQDGF